MMMKKKKREKRDRKSGELEVPLWRRRETAQRERKRARAASHPAERGLQTRGVPCWEEEEKRKSQETTTQRPRDVSQDRQQPQQLSGRKGTERHLLQPSAAAHRLEDGGLPTEEETQRQRQKKKGRRQKSRLLLEEEPF